MGPQNVKILGPRAPRIFKNLGALFLHDTGTMGAAHSENRTGSVIPSCSNQFSSVSTLLRRAYGTGRGRQKTGGTVGSLT